MPQNGEKFIIGVESLINPMEVSDILFYQKLKRLLPPGIMKFLLYRASKKTPYIGFAIDPYSLFLFFRLRDIEYAKSLLPDRYELAMTKLFTDDEPDYYLGIGNLNTRASTFWGTRQEVYLIATDKETGLLSFIFLDILSNTIIAHPTRGIADPNCSRAVFTTSSRGGIFLDIQEKKTNRKLLLTGSIKKGKLRDLDQQLWLMGNTSIGHSRRYVKKEDHPFAVIFDPAEVIEALDIPREDIHIAENTLFPELAYPEISHAICFPYAQHYIADSPGCYTKITDRDDLIAKYNKLAGSETLKTFSASTIVKQISVGIAITVFIAISLLLIF
ncbi:MAG: hypothetical protein JXR66_00380 [Bacteroidales bacterium]|nr:hypothetical protein [Bacteroidales bacterium]MBN2631980.1 hypothetical protein [Bacteroidales bacterium]